MDKIAMETMFASKITVTNHFYHAGKKMSIKTKAPNVEYRLTYILVVVFTLTNQEKHLEYSLTRLLHFYTNSKCTFWVLT